MNQGSVVADSFESVSEMVSNLPANVPTRIDIEGYKLKVVRLLGEGMIKKILLRFQVVLPMFFLPKMLLQVKISH